MRSAKPVQKKWRQMAFSDQLSRRHNSLTLIELPISMHNWNGTPAGAVSLV